jgi:hypothetical protein
LERFFDEGISIDMLRKKIVQQVLQQWFASSEELSGKLM